MRSAPPPRSGEPGITQKLELVWPAVSAQLSAMLRRRGVSSHDADEAMQETAARAMSVGVEFVDADDLFRWASVVSWRLAIDARRRCTRIAGDEVPDRADHVDVAQIAEHRIVLSAVTSRFKELSERDRAVLLASFDDQATPSRLESVRTAVARHRARGRLRGLLDGLAAPVAAFAARRWRWRSSQAQVFASMTAPALACLALGIAVAPELNRAAAAEPARMVTAIATPQPTTVVSAQPEAVDVPPARARSASAATSNDGWSLTLPAPPAAQPTRISTRPRTPNDHLICATLPSLHGPAETCVGRPVTP